MKRGIIFESTSGAVIDYPQEPTNVQRYANHLKGLGFLTEYRNGKIRPYLQGIKRPFLFMYVEDSNLKDLPTRVKVPPFSLNKFCHNISTHKEKKRRLKGNKNSYSFSGFIILRREVNEQKLLKEFIEAGCPENWTPKPEDF